MKGGGGKEKRGEKIFFPREIVTVHGKAYMYGLATSGQGRRKAEVGKAGKREAWLRERERTKTLEGNSQCEMGWIQKYFTKNIF